MGNVNIFRVVIWISIETCWRIWIRQLYCIGYEHPCIILHNKYMLCFPIHMCMCARVCVPNVTKLMYTVQKLVLLFDIVNNNNSNNGWRGNIDKLINMYALHFFIIFSKYLSSPILYIIYFPLWRYLHFWSFFLECEYDDTYLF